VWQASGISRPSLTDQEKRRRTNGLRSRVRDRQRAFADLATEWGGGLAGCVFTYSVPSLIVDIDSRRNETTIFNSRLSPWLQLLHRRANSIAGLRRGRGFFYIHVASWLCEDNWYTGAIPAIFSINFQRRIFSSKTNSSQSIKSLIIVHLLST